MSKSDIEMFRERRITKQMTRQQASSIFKNWKRLECCLKILNLDDGLTLIERDNEKIEVVSDTDLYNPKQNIEIGNNNITGISTNNVFIRNKMIRVLQNQLIKIDIDIVSKTMMVAKKDRNQ